MQFKTANKINGLKPVSYGMAVESFGSHSHDAFESHGKTATRDSASESWCAREDLNLQSFRNQILSLARLPFRHARNRHQPAPCTAESQAFVAVLCKPGEMTTATHRATTGDCASRMVCLGSCHVTLVQVGKRCMRCVARRRVECLHAVGAKPVERGKRAAFCSGQKPRKRNGFSRRDGSVRAIAGGE